ncbi:MAG: hypothetical protein LIR50_07130 [Bacillota bacterium]|nr:hypothetical protein [Bacillota bacterium]
MARGEKIDNKKIAEVITSYALTNNYNATARQCNVAANTVKNIINKQKKENPEEYAKVCEEKKELFQDKANKIIDKQLELLDRRVNTALDNEDTLDEIIAMVWEQDKKELNETQKKTIVNKIYKMQLNSLSEITTSMGTLYDKMRLANGESTNNDKYEIEIKVTE